MPGRRQASCVTGPRAGYAAGGCESVCASPPALRILACAPTCDASESGPAIWPSAWEPPPAWPYLELVLGLSGLRRFGFPAGPRGPDLFGPVWPALLKTPVPEWLMGPGGPRAPPRAAPTRTRTGGRADPPSESARGQHRSRHSSVQAATRLSRRCSECQFPAMIQGLTPHPAHRPLAPR